MSTQINPADYDEDGGNVWDHARREYLAGVKATHICQRYGMSLSSFRLHARVGGWRRMDQPTCDAPPEPGEYHPDDAVNFADLAQEAFLNIRRALGTGRASEASTWLRVYDRLADKARAHVMAELPDIVTPRIESNHEPLTLFAAEDENVNDLSVMADGSKLKPQQLDSLHPVFFGVQYRRPSPVGRRWPRSGRMRVGSTLRRKPSQRRRTQPTLTLSPDRSLRSRRLKPSPTGRGDGQSSPARVM